MKAGLPAEGAGGPDVLRTIEKLRLTVLTVRVCVCGPLFWCVCVCVCARFCVCGCAGEEQHVSLKAKADAGGTV